MGVRLLNGGRERKAINLRTYRWAVVEEPLVGFGGAPMARWGGQWHGFSLEWEKLGFVNGFLEENG